ncbi:LarC family nickel insertion protein [Methylobacterium radiodurans]|uniref:LarC family nickel insertion protein n=1 Tax=Methylobacterium radiodurans TaxID=2202828 RepID=A0A2U8VSZ0_9HYPH|nr:LarC family nickel insertion protein [Methylobacterium radiodurans]AWN36246.1 LarC family nickel insertion protein [Methylobacterium radiodurans]
MQIHLDAIGGMAGDMFAAALLDAFPEHEAGVLASVRAAARGAACELMAHNDGVLQGRRFTVAEPGEPVAHTHTHHHAPHSHPHGAHDHRHWSEIRAGLIAADLDPAVRDHALAIFGHLAEAEARVHGIPVADVAFHEVGAVDSIADIVAAAHLAAATGATRWSVSALPLGSGRVRTQHGFLPVPAPATALLLEGFDTIDDGVPGERVTPTGAAILRHLCGDGTRLREPRRLARSGIGFGTRTLPGLSNCVRALVFGEVGPRGDGRQRSLAVIEFEVDDQSGEDLAMGLDRLRAHPDVLDVVQMPVFGKKGRMMVHVRVLARAEALDAAAEACFRETTTIGLRHQIVSGRVLERTSRTVAVGGRDLRVKTVMRPGGPTAKAEADDALSQEGHAARESLRRAAERIALAEQAEEGRS